MASSQPSRHVRAVSYTLASLVLGLIAYLVLGFDRIQTVVYTALVYVFFNVLNYKTMFGRRESEDGSPPR